MAYITVVEGATLLGERYFNRKAPPYMGAAEADQLKLLEMASTRLDAFPWKQRLDIDPQWPRDGAAIPIRIQKACLELALLYSDTASDLFKEVASVRRVQDVSESIRTLHPTISDVPLYIQTLVAQYLIISGKRVVKPLGTASATTSSGSPSPSPTPTPSPTPGGPGVDQVARDSAAAAFALAQQAVAALATLNDTYSTDDERQAAVDQLQASIDALDTGTPAAGGTQVFVDTQEPSGGVYALDDIWIRDVPQLQIYKWTGTVWAVTYTLVEVPDIDLLAPGAAHGTPTQADYNANKVIAVDGQWFYVELTGHLADTVHWTWADLNDGQTDLSGWRQVVDENPFSIPNPQALDWAYVANEQRWVRYASSTWQYQPAPTNFNSRFRTQNAAQNGGLITVGRFIYDHNKNAMRVIRNYSGAVPGAPTYAWHSFQGEALDLETWAFTRNNVQVQARKLGIFPAADVADIPNDGEKFFALTARVHKNTTGDLTSYDLSKWGDVPSGGPNGGTPGAGTALAITRENILTEQLTDSAVIDVGLTEGLEANSLYQIRFVKPTGPDNSTILERLFFGSEIIDKAVQDVDPTSAIEAYRIIGVNAGGGLTTHSGGVGNIWRANIETDSIWINHSRGGDMDVTIDKLVFTGTADTGTPGDDAFTWATEGNTDPIPAAKLTLAPSASATDQVARTAAAAAQTTADGAVVDAAAAKTVADSKTTEAQVDGRILNQLPTISATHATGGTNTARQIWTAQRVWQAIRAALPTVTANDAEGGISTALRTWTAQRVRQAVHAVVPSWARVGNNTALPTAKLPTTVVQSPVNATQITSIQVITQAAHDALSNPSNNTMYIIVG